jgi:hypothetical protein
MADNNMEVIPLDDKDRTAPFSEQREAHMAQNLTRPLESNPEKRMVGFVGGFHARNEVLPDGKTLSLMQRLIKAGYTVVTVGFDRTSGDQGGSHKDRYIYNQTDLDRGTGADYIIHLPPPTAYEHQIMRTFYERGQVEGFMRHLLRGKLHIMDNEQTRKQADDFIDDLLRRSPNAMDRKQSRKEIIAFVNGLLSGELHAMDSKQSREQNN